MKTSFRAVAVLGFLATLIPAQAANTYQTAVAAQNPAHWFKLDNSLVDTVNSSFVLVTNSVKGGFTNDAFGVAQSAYAINQGTDALISTNNLMNGAGPGPDLTSTATGSLSMLFRTLSDTNQTGQRYILCQGINSSTHNQFSLFFENNSAGNGDPTGLKLRIGGTTTTIISNTPGQLLITNTWYYFGMTYDRSWTSDEVHYFIGPVGGTLTAGIFNLTDGDAIGDTTTNLFIGNKSTLSAAFRNPGYGIVDELAFWNQELSPDQINTQFAAAAGTVPVAPRPSLVIARQAGNVVLSWSTNSDGYQPEYSATVPNSNPWSSAGSPVLSGANFYLTNAFSAGNQFYRLHKP